MPPPGPFPAATRHSVPMDERLFVAIWPSAEARSALAAVVGPIRADYPDLRWQAEDRWHVTLAFLGQRSAPATARRIGRLAMPAAGPLTLTGAGTFGSVLWVGVEHGAWLSDLAAALRRALDVPEERFRAHVTVARGRGADPRAPARAAVPALAGWRSPAWLPDSLTLVHSRTGPHPEYRVVSRWPLPVDDPPIDHP